MSIVITGASGQLAAAVIESALETVDPSDLILVTRSPDELAELANQGAVVRYGDFNDSDTLVPAFSGGTRMLLISTDAVGERIEQHAATIDAAVAAGVGLVAYTSILNPVVQNPAMVVPEHMATEQKLRDSGLDWVFLRNSLYADMQFNEMASAAGMGRLVTNTGAGKAAYVTRRDCAAAAAAVLVGDGHAGRAYDIAGPAMIDAEERAAIFAAVSGKPVEVVHVDDETYALGMSEAIGLPVEATRSFATFGRAIREGHFAVASSDFRELTGRKPMGLREMLEAGV